MALAVTYRRGTPGPRRFDGDRFAGGDLDLEWPRETAGRPEGGSPTFWEDTWLTGMRTSKIPMPSYSSHLYPRQSQPHLEGYAWLATKNAVDCMPMTWAAATFEPPEGPSERTIRLRKSRFGVVGRVGSDGVLPGLKTDLGHWGTNREVVCGGSGASSSHLHALRPGQSHRLKGLGLPW